MSQQPTVAEQPASYSDNISLWNSQPLLQPYGQTYLGRVFVEVWDGDDTHLVATNDMLRETALGVLSGQKPWVPASNVPLTNRPATGYAHEQAFVGRVVIEVWNNQTVMGFSGSEAIVLHKALKALSD